MSWLCRIAVHRYSSNAYGSDEPGKNIEIRWECEGCGKVWKR